MKKDVKKLDKLYYHWKILLNWTWMSGKEIKINFGLEIWDEPKDFCNNKNVFENKWIKNKYMK